VTIEAKGTPMMRMFCLVAALALLGGCALISPPQAWEKGYLARPDMSMGGDALEQRYMQHIYSSKENASGGYGVGGGGCGCN
jgi:Domain of unknown function (DUF4266)